jgi:ubiquinone/menaquinone biosynthesis C-methylase UbiE
MHCHGGFSLDETTRRSWYAPEEIISELKEGMTFADIGCGDGYFTILAAKKVGSKGKVYAVDIDPSGVEKLENKAKSDGLTNIVAQVGKAEETVFCRECVDFILFSMDLHDFRDPVKVLLNAKEMLKPTGIVVDLDWKKISMPFGPPIDLRFSEERVVMLMRRAGLTVEIVKDAGPYHYVMTANREKG